MRSPIQIPIAPETADGGRETRRVLTIVSIALALLLTIAGLALGPASARAGTWNIYPSVVNKTGSTASTCSAAGSVGCIVHNGSGIVDGDWTSNPNGGQAEIPNGQTDHPNFDAPNFAEGADGYFVYTMPDRTQFSLVAEDDQGFDDAYNEAYPGCGAKQGQGPGDFVCLASYPAGMHPGYPSSSNFQPSFTFYPNVLGASGPPMTAAGQVCSTTGPSTLCAQGLMCDSDGGTICKSRIPGALNPPQWSPTDPNNFMWLNLVNLGDTSVTLTNQGMGPTKDGGLPLTQCTMESKGDTCSFQTSGGCAAAEWICGSDQIDMVVNNGALGGSVMVMQQAVIPISMGDHMDAALAAGISEAIWSGFGGLIMPNCSTCSDVSPPRISKLRAKVAADRGADEHKTRTTAAPVVEVAYRNSHRGPSVLTIARRRSGVQRDGKCVARTSTTATGGKSCTRWVDLPGVRARTHWDMAWTPSGNRACAQPAQRGTKGGVRCHRRTTLRGHLQSKGPSGLNRVRFSRVGGKLLTPGRYRVTAQALVGSTKSRPVSSTFRIGRAS